MSYRTPDPAAELAALRAENARLRRDLEAARWQARQAWRVEFGSNAVANCVGLAFALVVALGATIACRLWAATAALTLILAFVVGAACALAPRRP